ncbi:hypothetical protein VNO78_28332 [Psophocarpus tetragonolobus]|uniref:Wound-induced protein 1 n=1 Tax=Psophocarpus tetragonolobus TaxID=3891 RepID=A0AAN9S222_PSOTE
MKNGHVVGGDGESLVYKGGFGCMKWCSTREKAKGKRQKAKRQRRLIVLENLFLELANSQASAEDGDSSSKRLVVALYEALNSGDSDAVVKIVAPDLEWWFHGPPSHQFLMRMLTGQGPHQSFRFVPLSIASFGSTVIVEGCDAPRNIAWVHAWTLTNGIITHVREYFNTALFVTRFDHSDDILPSGRFPSLWQSTLSSLVGKSVPCLVLAI